MYEQKKKHLGGFTKLKPHTNMLRPGVLFIFSLHLFYESLSLGSLPHPHHHQGLVVTLVCQGALQEEGKHRRMVSDKEIGRRQHRHSCISYKSKGRIWINRLREVMRAELLCSQQIFAPHLSLALALGDRAWDMVILLPAVISQNESWKWAWKSCACSRVSVCDIWREGGYSTRLHYTHAISAVRCHTRARHKLHCSVRVHT